MDRREFLKASMTAAAGAIAASQQASGRSERVDVIDTFVRPDSLYHGDGWESMNPGYWSIQGKALRRRLSNVGDQRPQTQFPWHAETHQKKPLVTEYDPSLPIGLLWRRDWKLVGNYNIGIHGRIKALPPRPADSKHAHHQPGYGLIGICFGGKCLHESYQREGGQHAAKIAALHDDGTLTLEDHGNGKFVKPVSKKTPPLKAGDEFRLSLTVSEEDDNTCTIEAGFDIGDLLPPNVGKGRPPRSEPVTLKLSNVSRERLTEGYFGIAARGLLDVEINGVAGAFYGNRSMTVPLNECHVCYAMGDSLRQDPDGKWRCKFIAIFRNDGAKAELRIADTDAPPDGWQNVPISGGADIISNDFRRNTAVIDAELPANPGDKTLYYTIWKDGRDVTADPRPVPGSAAVGPGTGFIGETPAGDGQYVGRLPRLAAPYRLCGLSCHALANNKPNLPDSGAYQEWWLNDQPTPGAYQHLEKYEFQVMVWEDDVWYLELIFAPPSTDDAYKLITTTIAGPTSRWQMMRHWNIINPGDHDHGMDDVKGPEQILVRHRRGLGQDPAYMRRNFQIVSHLTRGEEEPTGLDNPRRWRRWKMPHRDFTLLVMDSRLWRSSQDTKIWDDEGWLNPPEGLYGRDDPTRALLGEEQFAWLTQMIRTDSSPLICLTGINGLHTVWTGAKNEDDGAAFRPRDRVAADYAGWVAAGADRVLELLGSRDGIVTVYGDVHNGCLMKNARHRVYECSFGPIGRSGGRDVKPGFARRMTDYDGRELEVFALYHAKFHSPDMDEASGPFYWNFLEMQFDPRPRPRDVTAQPGISMRIRNLVDGPEQKPRGGGTIEATIADTGRVPASKLSSMKLLPGADVLITTTDGLPVRGCRTLADGTLPATPLVDFAPGTALIVTVHAGGKVEARAARST